MQQGKRGPGRLRHHHRRLARQPGISAFPGRSRQLIGCGPPSSAPSLAGPGCRSSAAGAPPLLSCRGGFLFARVCVRDNERGLLRGVRAAGKGVRGFACLTEGQAEAGPMPSRKHRRAGVKCPVTAEGLRLLCPPLIYPLPFGRARSARMLSGSHPLSVYMGRD